VILPSEELVLVRAAKNGDDGAFGELVRRYDRNVFRIAQHITQNREDAEDVVQDAFLKAYTNLQPVPRSQSSFTPGWWRSPQRSVNEATPGRRERMVSLDEDD